MALFKKKMLEIMVEDKLVSEKELLQLRYALDNLREGHLEKMRDDDLNVNRFLSKHLQI